MVMSLIFSGVMSLTVHFGGRAFYAMFTTDEAVIQTGPQNDGVYHSLLLHLCGH